MDNTYPHTALKAQALSIGYPNKHSLPSIVQEQLYMEVHQEELICLMGPNGAGKSTLLRSLAGIQPPLAGEVMLGNRHLHSLSQEDRAKQISLVLTDGVSAGNMTVQELVALGRYPHTSWGGALNQQDKQVVEQAMEDLEVTGLAERPLFELSDGQRQKALIARALAQDGQLIILDEPTAHLDLINRLHIMRLLRLLAVRRKKAIIVATHELDLALQSADKLWLLHNNKGGLTVGAPEDLVLNGSLAEAFSRSGYHFDTISGHFVEEMEPCVSIRLKGEGPAFLWTQKALRRKGYGTAAINAEIQVEIKNNPGSTSWHISSRDTTFAAFSIEELLQQLAKL